MLQHNAFFKFSAHYLATRTIARDFTVDDAVMQQFKDYLKANQVDYTDADLATFGDWVKTDIKSSLFTYEFGQLEGLKVLKQNDPEIAKAMTYLPEATALVDHSKGPQKTASLH